MIKVSPTKTMEEILKIVCEKKNLEFEDHTMNLPSKNFLLLKKKKKKKKKTKNLLIMIN